MKKFLIPIFVFLMLIMPVLSLAVYKLGDPLVPPCDNLTLATQCDFNALMTLVNNVITFVLFYMVVPIAAIMFAYAGFLMIVPGSESASKKTKGKEIFWNAFIGLVLAAAAWLIVRTILLILGYEGGWILLNF